MSQNLNSFNLSTVNSDNKFKTKIATILAERSDIVLLQGTRLGGKIKILEDYLRHNQFGSFKIFANSTREARGVCIIVKHNLNFSIDHIYSDTDENIILLRFTKNNYSFLLFFLVLFMDLLKANLQTLFLNYSKYYTAVTMMTFYF